MVKNPIYNDISKRTKSSCATGRDEQYVDIDLLSNQPNTYSSEDHLYSNVNHQPKQILMTASEGESVKANNPLYATGAF